MCKLAVIGNPIAHSLSPVLFGIFAKQCNIQLKYERILANDEDHFAQVVQQFFAAGGLALNITSPFKHAAYKVANSHTPRAAFCQASNFLYKKAQDKIIADTTDGLGLLRDLTINQHLDLTQQRILILGSGFVLDSILLDLIVSNPRCIDVYARNYERLLYLQNKFAVGIIHADAISTRVIGNYDLIINTIPNNGGNKGFFSKITPIKTDSLCYDLNYSVGNDSVFLHAMRHLCPEICGIDGLGMLAEQAKIAFDQLFKCNVETQKALVEITAKQSVLGLDPGLRQDDDAHLELNPHSCARLEDVSGAHT